MNGGLTADFHNGFTVGAARPLPGRPSRQRGRTRSRREGYYLLDLFAKYRWRNVELGIQLLNLDQHAVARGAVRRQLVRPEPDPAARSQRAPASPNPAGTPSTPRPPSTSPRESHRGAGGGGGVLLMGGLRAVAAFPYGWGAAMAETENQFQLPPAFAASTAIHGALLLLLLFLGASTTDFVTPMAENKVELLQVRLVTRPGGGGGGPLPGLPSAPKGAPDLPAVAHQAPPPIPRVAAAPPPVAAPKPAPVATIPDSKTTAALRNLVPPPPSPAPAPAHVAKPAPAAAKPTDQAAGRPGDQADGTGAVASLGGPGGRGGGGAGTGNGTGGDGGDASARPAYGANPKPPYPLAARRLGVEGVVTLEVLVRADGRPAEVHVRNSSGSPLLDDSAVETVRSKWRFMPARRGNAPIESRVTFPIRFSLEAG